MLSKKGVITSQMFLYAFGIIVVILIVFAGYKAISAFQSSSETSGFRILQAKFSSDMASMASRTGEVRKFTYSVPSGYKKFCVFDLYNDANLDSAIFDFNPYFKNSLINKTENVFFLDNNKIFAFRTPEIRIKTYPYYSCTDIKGGSVSFSAKGSVINGQQSALMLVSNRVEVNILKYMFLPFTSCNGIGCTLDSELELISSDGLAKIIIYSDTTVTMPDSNTTIYIEVLRPGTGSETYEYGPDGTAFSQPFDFGIKDSDCNNFLNIPLEGMPSKNGHACKEGFILYDFTQI